MFVFAVFATVPYQYEISSVSCKILKNVMHCLEEGFLPILSRQPYV
jgi:hypothetical protein